MTWGLDPRDAMEIFLSAFLLNGVFVLIELPKVGFISHKVPI